MNAVYNPGALGKAGADLGGLVPQFIGFSSLFAALFSPRRSDALKLVVVGALVEGGRRLGQWLWERIRFRYYVSARFFKGDPSYEWVSNAVASHQLWRRSPNFKARAKTAMRMVAHTIIDGPQLDGHADFVPIYDVPYLFRWKGYWFEFQKSRDPGARDVMINMNMEMGGPPDAGFIDLKVFSRDINMLSRFVEDAHQSFIQSREQRVIIRSADRGVHNPYHGASWTHAVMKMRRPLDSLILEPGAVERIIADMQEFMKMENWYVDSGIPHRRGYLLHGPPGTGKTSTIHAIAGELDLDIYTVSLASGNIDDTRLQHVVSQVPARSILLMEDIDCAFPSRDDEVEESAAANFLSSGLMPHVPSRVNRRSARRSLVTLSGLLNVIDGIGSEDGRMFFATTNYVDRLDPAFLRPGRIDVKIEYKLANKGQARALFSRFFPESRFGRLLSEKSQDVVALANQFADTLPEHEFSTAEIQGYLLGYKTEPAAAVAGVKVWVEDVKEERATKKEREEKIEEKKRNAKLQSHRQAGEAMANGMGKILQQSLAQPNGEGRPNPGPRMALPTDSLQNGEAKPAITNGTTSVSEENPGLLNGNSAPALPVAVANDASEVDSPSSA
ncbi:P-loop containing nucleoside triphosphate hydrolase protein [Neolentinus lepideus HHB14362 ss-1]|uniref:p-loop containing nucleoside triphosphate hydrolase protein n=1 Tax=Neolentinus lepideus HHB14362 ss-1 TaxID=1314782 RepID=A0A165PPN3_9AGAM|nr:P-loop containing nucleoside triphosphate hydrolase protein [Neolentinus lepideus HHB14362 ss-1]